MRRPFIGGGQRRDRLLVSRREPQGRTQSVARSSNRRAIRLHLPLIDSEERVHPRGYWVLRKGTGRESNPPLRAPVTIRDRVRAFTRVPGGSPAGRKCG